LKNDLKWIVGILTVALACAIGIKSKSVPLPPPSADVQSQPKEFSPEPPKTPRIPNISVKIPPYLDYSHIVNQVKTWNQEAPDLTEVGFYGKTKQGVDICYIRICNKMHQKQKPTVLITGCIHGNEPLATSSVMAFAGNLLGEYGKNKDITDLVDSRDIYIVPVISPDSYPSSRHVDGVDPNRDFPGPTRPNHKSTPSIQAIQNFFLKIKPNATISGHTFGRVYLTPYGDRNQTCPNEPDYQRIIGQMCKNSGYKMDRACNNYGHPIEGSEVDWYYRNRSFSVVMEFGTHQRIPTNQEIKTEFDMTFSSVLYFIKEAPLVNLPIITP
jgi:hypothetical protein